MDVEAEFTQDTLGLVLITLHLRFNDQGGVLETIRKASMGA
jgi:hypothetical protein